MKNILIILSLLIILNALFCSISVTAEENIITQEMPISVNSSESLYFPPIQSQGSINTCSSWASVYYQFTYEVNKNPIKNMDKNAMQENNISDVVKHLKKIFQ